MIKYTFIILSTLCIFNMAVHANPVTGKNASPNHKTESGLGIGALIGGLIGGPPGAIIGAAGGAWFGEKEKREDIAQSKLEQGLIEKQAELIALRDEFQQLQGSYGQQLHRVSMESHKDTLAQLSQGISLTVYFRTNSADIDPEFIPRIEKLVGFIDEMPEIQIQLDAHADRRGDEKHNKKLSEKRAQTIQKLLQQAGLDLSRVHSHAFGESQALSALGDEEGYVFDRRVSIQLSLDTEI